MYGVVWRAHLAEGPYFNDLASSWGSSWKRGWSPLIYGTRAITQGPPVCPSVPLARNECIFGVDIQDHHVTQALLAGTAVN